MLLVFACLPPFSLLSSCQEKVKREIIKYSSVERAENSPLIYMEEKKMLTVCKKRL